MAFNISGVIILFAAISYGMAQPIHLSGVVRDSATSALLRGIEVRLQKNGVADTTDSAGYFTLTFNLQVSAGSQRILLFMPPRLGSRGEITFSIADNSNISVQTYSLQGKTVFSMRDVLAAGVHTIVPEVYSSGVFISQVRIGCKTYVLRYTNTGSVAAPVRQPGRQVVNSPSLQKLAAMNVFLDTLQFSGAGYYTVKTAVRTSITDTTILMKAHPRPLSYAGIWNGYTLEGEPITFTITGMQVTGLSYTLGMAGLSSYTAGSINGLNAGVAGSSFSCSSGSISFSGSFSGDTVCTGLLRNSSFSSTARVYGARKQVLSDTSNARLLALIRQFATGRNVSLFPSSGIIGDTLLSTVDSIRIKPVACSPDAKISVADRACSSGGFSQVIPLVIGDNQIAVKVVAKDGLDSVLYNLEVRRLCPLTLSAANGTITTNVNKTDFLPGDTILLTAQPNTGYHFTGWSGDTVYASGNTAVVVKRDASQTVTATFAANPVLTISGIRAELVVKIPDKPSYMPGDTVILRAAPDQFMNYRFSGWSGDTLKTSSDTAWVVMTSPTRAVTAIYTPQFTLAIQAVGNVYTKTPDKNFYLTGETVKIVATPPANDPITLWSGDTTRTSNDTAWVTFESTGKSIVLQCTTPVIGSFTVDHTNDILCFSYSPDGTRIATGSRDKSAKLLDVNGQTIRTFSGHTGIVEAIAFSPDGTMLLTGSSDSTARLWNVETGALVRTFYGHTGGVMDVAFSPNGAKIITGSLDSTARLWNTATGVIIDTLSGHTDIVQTVACSPDGATVATGSFDKTVKIWDIATGEVRHTLNACTWQVFSIAYSPDGSTILTGGNDSLTTAKLWNANTGALIHEFGGSECTYTVAFSRSGKKILTGGAAHHAILWDAQAYTVIRDINMSAVAIWRLTFSPDERYALLLYKDTKNVYRMYAR